MKSIQKPKIEHLNKIFVSSMKFFVRKENLDNIVHLTTSFSEFIQSSEENMLTSLLNKELQTLNPSEKTFVMNEMIIYLIKNLSNPELTEFTKSVSRLLELFIKSQFKKFSTESSNIQKIVSLVKE